MTRYASVAPAALILAVAVAPGAAAWDVTVHSVDNAIDVCGALEQPADKVVTVEWYRGVPYECWIPSDQPPVYFDSSHLGTFEGVHFGGVLGSTEASRMWAVRALHPGETIQISPSYQNLASYLWVPDCGNLSDNSGVFGLGVRPTGWGKWPSLPAQGSGIAVVIDPVTGIVYVFGGGCNNAQHTNTTWWLDPRGFGDWMAIPADTLGPVPRWFASGVYDPNPDGNRRMIIFGGAQANQAVLNDTWALDLVTHTWSQITTSGNIPGCLYHRAVLDPNPGGNRRMLVYGDAHHIGSRTYALDLATQEWTVLQGGAGAPPQRNLPGLALYEPIGGHRQMIAFAGGHSAVYRNDIWSLDLETLMWTELPTGQYGPPGTREGTTMVIDSGANEAIVFGGRNSSETYNDLWYYDLAETSWVPVAFPEENWPAARSNHAMVYDQRYDAVLVLGGSAVDAPCDEPTVAVYVTDFDWYGHPTGVDSQPATPAPRASSRAWPVPSAGLTRIEFDLRETARVQGAIFDASGARVRTLVDAILPASTHRLEWDGSTDEGGRVPAGVYFYRVQGGSTEVRGKIVTVK